MESKQFIFSLILSTTFMLIIIKLVQTGRLDIKYCWFWLSAGVLAILLVLKYDLLVWISGIIGVVTPTTTLFIFATLILFVLCLYLFTIISTHRRQIKKLAQTIAILTENK
ncbi:MAG: DUF2304 domain-containing protein [Nitrospirae bacterium]|nr:DUF2304 domain-containing protein [Nitrospirota bacterium]